MAPGRCDHQENIESPAYLRGGHESAGFCGCGIQQATRLSGFSQWSQAGYYQLREGSQAVWKEICNFFFGEGG